MAVEVNGKPAHFLIDTGGPDIIIDPDFAKEIGATVVDDGASVFAGGLRATVRRTVVDSFALGGLAVSKQAAGVLPTRGLPFGGKTSIDGVIGTGFLMHFLATIDYGHHALILAPRENVVVRPGATSVPMWFVGDHFIFARGAINGVPMLMLVDTGLAGGGVMPSAASVTAAHIALDKAHATQGIGGGGPVTAVPFVAKSVALGAFTRTDVGGIYTPEGSPLSAFPFAVGGVVSHGFFSPGALTFDFANMRLIVTK
ncbi:MAG: retropepsin-like domain-containing protein [Candidatus Eremiobacteraeota bacterium]|nr:retropepsin-like domain-containing protein [Candidatus Eremiobacteraeota bacterium]